MHFTGVLHHLSIKNTHHIVELLTMNTLHLRQIKRFGFAGLEIFFLAQTHLWLYNTLARTSSFMEHIVIVVVYIIIFIDKLFQSSN